MSNYRIVDEELVSSYKEGYLGKEKYKVTFENGKTTFCERITKGGRDGDAVVIIPITEDNKYVMIMEVRPNTYCKQCISFPAGMVDENEDAINAAKRELSEETGYTCTNLYEIDNYYQDHGCSKAIVRVFLATNCKKTNLQNLDESEVITAKEFSYDDVLKMMRSSNVYEEGIVDSGSKMAFMKHELLKRGVL